MSQKQNIKKIRKAVFPVAGLGTRFLPATKAMPKEMLTVIDMPLIQYAVEEAIAAGITEMIFVTGWGKTAIENHFDKAVELEQQLKSTGNNDALEKIRNYKGITLSYTRQSEPLGLGHAVNCAKSLVGDEPFAVLLADDVFRGSTPCLKQMVNAYSEVGGNLVAVMDVPDEQTQRYGILKKGSDDGTLVEVLDLVEKPALKDAPSRLAISGRYILQPEIFEHLSKGETGVNGEIQLTDSMVSLINSQSFHGFRYEGKRYDCGSKLGWLEANIAFAHDRPELKDGLIEMMKKYLN